MSEDLDKRYDRERAFFSVPPSAWEDVSAENREYLHRVAGTILQSLEGVPGPAPNEVAMQLLEAGNRLFIGSADDERDLRQIISTLRTAMAVCWDMYSAIDAPRVTVEQHMDNLKESIAEFERDLQTLQDDKAGQSE